MFLLSSCSYEHRPYAKKVIFDIVSLVDPGHHEPNIFEQIFFAFTLPFFSGYLSPERKKYSYFAS